MEGRLDRLGKLGVRYPVMQAGMPGAANVRLAAAVSRAGGIGTLGLQDVSTWENSLAQLMVQADGHPVNANLLLPYTRKAHVLAVLRQQIPIVTLFWGTARAHVKALQAEGRFVFQQIGSVNEANAALETGVDGLIVQGMEAGGHVRGIAPLSTLLPQVRALSDSVPCFAAGGMYNASDVRRVAALGADGVSSGSRFLVTAESHAHPAYKQRILDASETLYTRLFGLGWSAPHRVIPNKATRRWCAEDGSVPAWLNALNDLFAFTRKVFPFKAEAALRQKPGVPLFTNAVLDASLPEHLVESCPLYAGERVADLQSMLTAEAAVHRLAEGFSMSEEAGARS